MQMNTFRRAATLALSFALVIALAMKVDAYQLITNSMISPTAGISLTKLTAPAAGVMVSDGGVISSVAPGTTGNVLTSDGTKWTSAAAASGGGWQTAIDCDFTAEASHTFTADTTYTICGQTWNVEGLPGTNPGGLMSLTNGSGLVVGTSAASGGSDYGGLSGGATTYKSAPHVWLPLSALSITGLDWSSRLRVSVYVTNQSIPATDGAIVFWGIDNDTPASGSTGSTWYAVGCTRENVSGVPALGAFHQTGAITTKQGENAGIGPATWTAAISSSRCEFRLALQNGEVARADYSSAYSAGWPAGWSPWALDKTGPVNSGQNSGSYLGFANLNAPTTANRTPSQLLGVTAGITYLDSFSHGSTATIARLRVEYRL